MRRPSMLAAILVGLAVLTTSSASAMYHPTLGRWAARDPMGHTNDMSIIQYVGANPLRRTDPSGLIFEELYKAAKQVYHKITGTEEDESPSGADAAAEGAAKGADEAARNYAEDGKLDWPPLWSEIKFPISQFTPWRRG